MKQMTFVIFWLLSANAMAQNSRFVLPVPLDSIKHITEYSWRTHPITHEKKLCDHIEYQVPEGTKIFSITKGKVIFADQDLSGWGLCVDIRVNDSTVIKYAHLSKILVKNGQTIKCGQIVGLAGSTGKSTAPHLGMRVEINGKPVNPRKIYNLP